MASDSLTRLLRNSGMDRDIRDYMDDHGYFSEADRYFNNEDFSSARRALENGLYNAIESNGGDYTYNFEKIKYAVGNLIGW